MTAKGEKDESNCHHKHGGIVEAIIDFVLDENAANHDGNQLAALENDLSRII